MISSLCYEGNISPGTVLILLAGHSKGKRVVLLKQLEYGIFPITGPFKVNGVSLRRVDQAYVIATSTKFDVSSVDIAKYVDVYFEREVTKNKKGKFVFFEARKEESNNHVTVPLFDGHGEVSSTIQTCLYGEWDRDEAAWLEMFPIHLDDEAWWYDAQPAEVKKTWLLLMKELLNEFQEKKNYHVMLGTLILMKQKTNASSGAAENVHEFVTRIKEVRSCILRSLRKTPNTEALSCSTPTSSAATVARIDSLVLRTFIRGLILLIQEIVGWKELETLEAAISSGGHLGKLVNMVR